mmetsp:Transcript_105576/g.273392  ORF Transcript_105576/g.273392 Transcript_105576/m.273392 type:complete len:261 (+) Transcript_105576:556-1338(+)
MLANAVCADLLTLVLQIDVDGGIELLLLAHHGLDGGRDALVANEPRWAQDPCAGHGPLAALVAARAWKGHPQPRSGAHPSLQTERAIPLAQPWVEGAFGTRCGLHVPGLRAAHVPLGAHEARVARRRAIPPQRASAGPIDASAPWRTEVALEARLSCGVVLRLRVVRNDAVEAERARWARPRLCGAALPGVVAPGQPRRYTGATEVAFRAALVRDRQADLITHPAPPAAKRRGHSRVWAVEASRTLLALDLLWVRLVRAR